MDLDRTYLQHMEGRDHYDDRLGDQYDQNYINQWNTANLWAKVVTVHKEPDYEGLAVWKSAK